MAKVLCITIAFLLSIASMGQRTGTITIMKNKTSEISEPSDQSDFESELEHMNGLYCSGKIVENARPQKRLFNRMTRYYFYFVNDQEVCFFRSRRKPKFHFKNIHTIPMDHIEEIGKYEIYKGELYMEMKSLYSNEIYRYNGQANSTQIWLGVRAACSKKMKLDVYLNKCTE
jgi:hypothetical protein